MYHNRLPHIQSYQSWYSLPQDGRSVQALCWCLGVILIDLLILLGTGDRYTDMLHGAYSALLLTSFRPLSSVPSIDPLIIIAIAVASLIAALIEQGTAWPELYLLILSFIIISYTAAHIVATQFARRTVTAIALLLMLGCKLFLSPTASGGTMFLQLISSLTILLPCIT